MKTISISSKIIAVLLFFCFSLTACNDDYLPDQNDDDFIPGQALESKSIKIGLEGGTLKMPDGTKVVVPAEGVLEEFTLEVSRIDPKRLFSSSNSMIYDIDFNIAPFFLEIQFQLAKGLNEGDIAITCIDPNDIGDEITGINPGFIYDPKTGYATSFAYFDLSLKSAGNLKGLKHELLFTRWVIEWDENVEGKVEGMCMDVPYYMQPGGTCVSACALMLTKAYIPYKDRKDEYEIQDFLKNLGIGKDDGVGPYTFLYNLDPVFKTYTGTDAKTEAFFSRKTLRSTIIRELDISHPVILNLSYPGTGRHAILIVGYEKVTSGSQAVTYNLIYHNPDLSEHMYQKNSFEWLMSDKTWRDACQILYPTDKIHTKRTLQTIGMPLGEDGIIRFEVPGKKRYSINLDYDQYTTGGYNWFDGRKQVIQTIPDTVGSLELSLPIWNADRTHAKKIRLRTQISQKGATSAVFLEDIEIDLPATKDPFWFNKSIPLKDVVKKDGDRTYSILIQSWSEYNDYLDGFYAEASIAPPKEKKFSVAIIPLDPDGVPVDKEGKTGVEYGFQAKCDGLPSGENYLEYRWDFDGEPPVAGLGDTRKITYTRAGTFQVKVEVWDYKKNTKLGEDKVIVTIKSELLLFTTNGVNALARIKYKDVKYDVFSFTNVTAGESFTWTGNSFTGGRSQTWVSDIPNDSVRVVYNTSCAGEVSSDGKTLLSLSLSSKEIGHYVSDGKLAWHNEGAFTLQNLKFKLDSSGEPLTVIDVSGSEFVGNVTVSKYIKIKTYQQYHDQYQTNHVFHSIDPDMLWIKVEFMK